MEIADASVELARKGSLTARLASSPQERDQAFALRYQVFCEEAGAESPLSGRETDRFDEACDHLLLLCPEKGVVGTCRLLPQHKAEAGPGFYSTGEFDVPGLIRRHPSLRFLELGRSCIAASHRSSLAASLMWQAIWTYVRMNRLDVMMGCASFEGTDPALHAEPLAFLAQNCAAPDDWQVDAAPGRGVAIPQVAADARAALRKLPPLLKGYVRLGAWISREAVIDAEFNTTDVFVTLPVSRIDPRYFAHYGAPEAQALMS